MDKKNLEETTCESYISFIKCSIFKTYYLIISSQFKMKLLFIFFLILDALQIITLILFDISLCNLYQNKYPQIQSLISLLSRLVTLYSPNDFISASVCLYVTLLFLMIQYAIFIYYSKNNISYKIEKNLFKQIMFKILLILNIFYQSIFMIPIFITIFSMFQCTTMNDQSNQMLNFSNIACNSTIYYINLVIGSVTLLFFVLISLINTVFLNDNRPLSKIPLCFHDNFFIDLIPIVLKLILSLFYSFSFVSIQYYIKIILVIVLTILQGGYKMYLPIYNSKIMFYFSMFFQGKFIFISLISFINYLIKTQYTNELVIVIFITSIFFGGLFLFVSLKIKNFYKYQNFSSIHDPKFAYLKIQIMMEEAKEFKSNNFKRMYITGLLEKHKMKCLDKTCLCNKYVKIYKEKNFKDFQKKPIEEKKKTSNLYLDGEIRDISHENISKSFETAELINEENDLTLNECIYGIIKIYLEELIEEFPKMIELNITFCYLMTYFLNNSFKSLYEIMKLSKKNYDISNEYKIYCLHKEIENNIFQNYQLNKDYYVDIESIMQYNDIISKILDLMEKTTEKTIEFWGDVKSDIKKSKIYQSSEKISHCLKKMKVYYFELMDKLRFRNLNFLHLYSDFLQKIIFNENEGIELKEKICQIQKDIDTTFQIENETEVNKVF